MRAARRAALSTLATLATHPSPVVGEAPHPPVRFFMYEGPAYDPSAEVLRRVSESLRDGSDANGQAEFFGEVMLYWELVNHPLRTRDASRASLFVVPALPQLDPQGAQRAAAGLALEPTWRLRRGADHMCAGPPCARRRNSSPTSQHRHSSAVSSVAPEESLACRGVRVGSLARRHPSVVGLTLVTTRRVACTHWQCAGHLGALFHMVALPGLLAALERNVVWLDPRVPHWFNNRTVLYYYTIIILYDSTFIRLYTSSGSTPAFRTGSKTGR